MTVVKGGKSVYGASVGILMLETRFPRIPGDMGNAATWDFPVRYSIVPGASPERVVRNKAEGLLDVFVKAARDLVSEGCDGITTNCGFLSLMQQELSEAVGVPVAAGVLYPFFGILLSPMIAAAAMSLSSVSVIGNALRLNRAKL